MFHLICGKSGSGKTARLHSLIASRIQENPADRFDIFLIVPTQETVIAERRIASLLGNRANLRVEVLNFDRMANRVSRSLGHMTYEYADPAVRNLVMYRALCSLAPSLRVYSGAARSGEFAGEMVKTADELRSGLVSPGMLERAAAEIAMSGTNSAAAEKIGEVALISAAYSKSMENLGDMSDELVSLAGLLDGRFSDGGKHRRFFEDKFVYIDSFDSFSGTQRLVLAKIIAQAKETFMTLRLPPEEEGSQVYFADIYYRARETEKQIGEICALHGVQMANKLTLTDAPRFATQGMRDAQGVFSGAVKRGADDGTVTYLGCANIYGEAEAAAKYVLRAVRENGCMYRDIQITAADLEPYSGILDSVFAKYSIPLFMAKRAKLASKPLMACVLSLLALAVYDFRTENVCAYIKNPLTGFTQDEADEFTLYITTWKIAGQAKFSRPFAMHPDGYLDYPAEGRVAEYIAKMNSVRMRFEEQTAEFMRVVRQEETAVVRELTGGLISYLSDIRAYESLCAEHDELFSAGDFAQALECAQIWNIFISLCEKLVSVCGGEVVGAKEYMHLMEFLIEGSDIGKIPTSVDEVAVSAASTMRSESPKCLIILGANSGVFPAAVGDSGIFDDRELTLMKEYGIDYAADSQCRAVDQINYFVTAAAAPSHRLFFTWRQTGQEGGEMKPSFLADMLIKAYPSGDESKNRLFALEGAENGLYFCKSAYQSRDAGERLTAAVLRRYFASDEEYKKRLDYVSKGFKEREFSLSGELAEKIISPTLSSTRLDCYANCRFSYFFEYIMNLRDQAKPSMQLSDIGTYMHAVLEIVMLRALQSGKSIKELSDEEIDALCHDASCEYLASVIKDFELATERFRYLVASLERALSAVIRNLRDEFADSSFTPAAFELPVNFTPGAVPPLEIKLPDSPGRRSVKIIGKIDRVDVFGSGGGICHVRVVDYKSGSKSFDASDILNGVNLQMYLYLFAISENGMGGSSGEYNKFIPAGILYVPAKPVTYKFSPDTPPGELAAERDKQYKRTGLLVDDPEILTAMENSLSGRFIPVTARNIASPKSRKSAVFVPQEEMQTLAETVKNVVAEIAGDMFGGDFSALPLGADGHNKCSYCSIRAVCRREDGDGTLRRQRFSAGKEITRKL